MSNTSIKFWQILANLFQLMKTLLFQMFLKHFDIVKRHPIFLIPCTVDNIFRPSGIWWREWSIQIHTRSFIKSTRILNRCPKMPRALPHGCKASTEECPGEIFNPDELLWQMHNKKMYNKWLTRVVSCFLSLKFHLWCTCCNKQYTGS